jgi:hypothetical protein
MLQRDFRWYNNTIKMILEEGAMRFFKAFVIGLLLLLVAWNFSLAADPASEIKLDIKEFQLKNGMPFLIVERPTCWLST